MNSTWSLVACFANNLDGFPTSRRPITSTGALHCLRAER